MWDPPWPGMEPVSPARAGRFFTTEPPQKPYLPFFITLLTSLECQIYSLCLHDSSINDPPHCVTTPLPVILSISSQIQKKKKKKFLIVKPLMPLCLPFAQQMTIPPASQKSIKWEFPLFLLPSVNAASACSFPVHSFSPKQPFHLSWPSPWSPLFLKNSASPLIAQMVKNLPAMQETQVPWRKMPWRRTQQPTPVFLPGDSHGQSSLAGYRPWGHKSWTWLSDFHFLTRIFIQPMPNPITVHERNFLLILLSLQPPPLLSLLFHSETSRNELPKLIVSISLHLSLLCCFRISASLKITMTSWPLWFEAKHC